MATLNDKAVLSVIFNPELPSEAAFECDIPTTVPTDQDASFDESLLVKVKALEKQAVIDAEAGKLSQSLEQLDEAIRILPLKASLYNNRAQVYQLVGQLNDAISDLGQAIKLSNGIGSVAMNAFTQRAIIAIAQTSKEKSGESLEIPEQAREDLKMAANLGSEFAKKLLIKFNPYSALCNSMLNSMMKELSGKN